MIADNEKQTQTKEQLINILNGKSYRIGVWIIMTVSILVLLYGLNKSTEMIFIVIPIITFMFTLMRYIDRRLSALITLLGPEFKE